MAVGNSLANRAPKQGLTAYLTQDAVKNQINSVIGGKTVSYTHLDVYKRQGVFFVSPH